MITTSTVEWSPGRTVTLRHLEGHRQPAVLLAHGAGVDQDHPMQVAVRDAIAAAGFPVVTFNYPYKEEGRGRPDRADVLLDVHGRVAGRVREMHGSVALVGRSMGGRLGTMLAAEPYPYSGVVALAYPLHPVGKPGILRIEHLPLVRTEVLMVVGDRDPMCTMELYDEHVRHLPLITTKVIADGDHAFRVRASSGRTNEEAFDEVMESVLAFLDRLEEKANA